VTPLQLPTNERSAYLIHAHTATNGAILAASDSEILQTGRSTYAYVWPRDSALVAMAMADAGFPEYLEQNGRFILDHIQPNQPYLLQKFCPDGNLGSTWHAWTREAHFQQDETALTVLSMCELLLNHNAPEDAQSWFERFIEPACEWMVEYVDPENGLPRASFDLWEERLDVHSWTVCTVISALRSAAWTADFMGRLDLHDRWQQAAEAYKTAFEKHLIDQKTMVVRRSLGSDLVDSSILAVELFDIFPADHPVVTATLERVRETLSVGGGIARYEGDYYYREGDGYSGNPWVICSLWVAQVLLMQDKVSEADGYIDWVRSVSLGGGLLPEQVGGLSGQIVGVCPLVWSHAEWLRTVTLRARVVGD
jgi:GH15 family glucan-1,4-alpha-glucosidase